MHDITHLELIESAKSGFDSQAESRSLSLTVLNQDTLFGILDTVWNVWIFFFSPDCLRHLPTLAFRTSLLKTQSDLQAQLGTSKFTSTQKVNVLRDNFCYQYDVNDSFIFGGHVKDSSQSFFFFFFFRYCSSYFLRTRSYT